MENYERIVEFLKRAGVEVRRSNVHWALYGQGIFDLPSKGINGASFQDSLMQAVSKGLIVQRKTNRATYLQIA